MRTKNSLINITSALIGQSAALVISLISRNYFIQLLGNDYLSVNGLFTQILTMLSLVELGIGPAIVFCLYKPLAENDREKIKTLMRLFKKAYFIIGILVIVLGTALTPFINTFMKEQPNIPYIHIVFLLFVINSAISYFFSYKRSLVIADQHKYIDTIQHYSIYAVFNILQIIFLFLTRNYIIFLILQIISTFTENLAISLQANRMYPYLKEKANGKLDKATRQQIVRNTYSMVLHKAGGIVVNSTDNILISTIIGLSIVGFYSNYQLIVVSLRKIVDQIFSALTPSIGNLHVSDSNEKSMSIFYSVFFIDFWIYCFCSICFIAIANPFIAVVLHAGHLLLPFDIVLIIGLNLYISGLRQAVLTFRDAYGIYYQDRFKPLIESAVNLVVSIVLAYQIGTIGIFIGTAVSTLTVCTWVEPYILYKYGFKQSVVPYIRRYLLYTGIAVAVGGLTLYCCAFFKELTLLTIIGRLGICILIPNTIIILLFRRTPEFRYLWGIVIGLIQALKRKLKRT